MRFSPGCYCCDRPPPPCIKCSADDETVSVTFAGFGSAYCDCSWLNATFVLDRDPDEFHAPCAWTFEGTQACTYYYSPIVYKITAFAINDGTETYWEVIINLKVAGYTLTSTTYRWMSGSATMDCTATQNIPFKRYSTLWPYPTRHICLNHASTTCQIN